MYTFFIKDDGPDLDIIITRALLALAALASVVYRSDQHLFLSFFSAALLVAFALTIKILLVKFKISKLLLLCCAAVVLFIATRSIAFALILLAYGYIVKFLNREPVIDITKEGIIIRKLFVAPAYQWSDFSNIVLKDNLLTLDFKNNKLLQVDIDETRTTINEKEFNDFCKSFV